MSSDRKLPVEPDAESVAEELVRFFHALPDAVRRHYEALAAADRTFGEDVEKERTARKADA